MKKGRAASVLFSVIISSAVFFLIGLIMLPAELDFSDNQTPVGDEISNIPYYNKENLSLLFSLPDSSGGLIYLNFDENKIELKVYSDHAAEQAEKSRYGVDYTLKGDSEMLCTLCDRIGGIELMEGGGKRRYFSAGLRQKLSEKLSFSERCEIALSFFKKISKIGLSSDDFMFIIKETETNLSYPICFGFMDSVKALAENTELID